MAYVKKSLWWTAAECYGCRDLPTPKCLYINRTRSAYKLPTNNDLVSNIHKTGLDEWLHTLTPTPCRTAGGVHMLHTMWCSVAVLCGHCCCAAASHVFMNCSTRLFSRSLYHLPSRLKWEPTIIASTCMCGRRAGKKPIANDSGGSLLITCTW